MNIHTNTYVVYKSMRTIPQKTIGLEFAFK